VRLTLSRSTHLVGLSQDLDDDAVSLLIESGLKNRFPPACSTWKSLFSESKNIKQKSIYERKKHIDEELEKEKPFLVGTFVREMIRRISEAFP
jgi:hypothetical protein